MSRKKVITKSYIADLCAKIKNGERPSKEDDDFISRKMFIREMMPHIKSFLSEGYSYKEIAVFLDHVSGDDLKKAVAEDAENVKPLEAEPKKMAQQDAAKKAESTPEMRIPCKGCSGRKPKPTK